MVSWVHSVKNHSFELSKKMVGFMRKTLFLFIIQIAVIQLYGQKEFSFQAPLNIPLLLSGNFGEIRSDHFHSGIDIKTQGSIGHHISAIESGYISRIKVQANGYGKSIYLAHPDGHTSVYGHLDRYSEEVEIYVKEQQYKRKSHQIDLYLKASDFPLEKGDFIGYSGNSGSSMGPHLHFEIRNSANQHPTNVLQYGFKIKDEIAPRFKRLFIYPMEEGALVNGSSEKKAFELVLDQGIYTIPWGTNIEVSGAVGLGVEVYDYLNGASNRCGIYTLEGYMDEVIFYRHEMEEFSFSETRYVNAHIDYEEKKSLSRNVHRLHRLPNDKLRIYRDLENDGILQEDSAGSHTIKVNASDVAGNTSLLSFKLNIKGRQPGSPSPGNQSSLVMKFDEDSRFYNEKVQVEVPAGALFEDIRFSFKESPGSNGFLSENFHIHSPHTPLFKAYTLSVIAPEVAPELRDKLVFVTYDPEEKKITSAGGAYSNGRVIARLRSFGEYAVSLDTIAPEIIPIKGSAAADQSGRKALRFTIRDDISDIAKYEGYVDMRWVLFEYDPKNDLLSYSFDKDRISPNSDHELELYVSDSQGNVNLYHTTFTW